MTINILSLLKSAEWARLAVEQNRLVSPLPVEGVEASSAAPVIAYGVDQADNVAFLPATESTSQRVEVVRDQPFAALRWGTLKEPSLLAALAQKGICPKLAKVLGSRLRGSDNKWLFQSILGDLPIFVSRGC